MTAPENLANSKLIDQLTVESKRYQHLPLGKLLTEAAQEIDRLNKVIADLLERSWE